jgi:hypothetical protein
MYIHYSIDKDGNHLMQLSKINIKAYGRDKDEAHRNLLNEISGTVAELEAMARSTIGNIQLQEITLNASHNLIDKEHMKTVIDVIMRKGRANGCDMLNADEAIKRMIDMANQRPIVDTFIENNKKVFGRSE